MTDPSSTLHEGLQQRDPTALDRLIAEFSGPVLHLAGLILGQTGRPEDAEEVAADAFAAAWDRIGEFDPRRTNLKSWLLMLTKYAALDRRRQFLRQRYTLEGEARVIPLEAAPEPAEPETPEGELLRRDRQERLHQALGQLPAADRELLIRRYFLEETIPDMAREAGLSRSAIDNRLWRARQAVKALLADESEVQPRGHEAL